MPLGTRMFSLTAQVFGGHSKGPGFETVPIHVLSQRRKTSKVQIRTDSMFLRMNNNN